MIELEPPDPAQCQCLKPNGATFMSMGGVPRKVRCTNKPVVIISEKEPQADGQIGSMSLCRDCLAVFNKQEPEHNVFVELLS